MGDILAEPVSPCLICDETTNAYRMPTNSQSNNELNIEVQILVPFELNESFNMSKTS